MKYIDIHSHVNFSDFDADREAVIARAHGAGIGMINVGTDIESSKKAVELAEKNEDVWATVGIHPTEIAAAIDWRALEGLAMHPKVVAIGECGLDYFNAKPDDFVAQKEVFEKHIELANKVGKPLMLHIRNAKTKKNVVIPANANQQIRVGGPRIQSIATAPNISGDSISVGMPSIVGNAYQDALLMLKKSAKVRANFHFFAGTPKDMEDILSAGHAVSFTGVLSFTSDYDELVRNVPADHMMSETDCPFVAPVPYRGKRNEPAYVAEVANAIARIRGEDAGKISIQLVNNAVDFFKLA